MNNSQKIGIIFAVAILIVLVVGFLGDTTGKASLSDLKKIAATSQKAATNAKVATKTTPGTTQTASFCCVYNQQTSKFSWQSYTGDPTVWHEGNTNSCSPGLCDDYCKSIGYGSGQMSCKGQVNCDVVGKCDSFRHCVCSSATRQEEVQKPKENTAYQCCGSGSATAPDWNSLDWALYGNSCSAGKSSKASEYCELKKQCKSVCGVDAYTSEWFCECPSGAMGLLNIQPPNENIAYICCGDTTNPNSIQWIPYLQRTTCTARQLSSSYCQSKSSCTNVCGNNQAILSNYYCECPPAVGPEVGDLLGIGGKCKEHFECSGFNTKTMLCLPINNVKQCVWCGPNDNSGQKCFTCYNKGGYMKSGADANCYCGTDVMNLNAGATCVGNKVNLPENKYQTDGTAGNTRSEGVVSNSNCVYGWPQTVKVNNKEYRCELSAPYCDGKGQCCKQDTNTKNYYDCVNPASSLGEHSVSCEIGPPDTVIIDGVRYPCPSDSPDCSVVSSGYYPPSCTGKTESHYVGLDQLKFEYKLPQTTFSKGSEKCFTKYRIGTPISLNGQNYELCVKTGRRSGADTQSSLYLVAYENLNQFRLYSDITGSNPEWFVEYSILKNLNDGSIAANLPQKWMDKTDNKMDVDNYKLANKKVTGVAEVKVVVSGWIPTGASTKDGSQYVELPFTPRQFGQPPEQKHYIESLNNLGVNDFTTGSTNYFYIEVPKNPDFTGFRVGNGNNDALCVERIEILDIISKKSKVWDFDDCRYPNDIDNLYGCMSIASDAPFSSRTTGCPDDAKYDAAAGGKPQ